MGEEFCAALEGRLGRLYADCRADCRAAWVECALWIAEHDQVGNRIEDIAGAAGVAELHTANEQL
eukprot:SAG22_NODE_159_length_16948_cov_14.480503_16_plen_65_part_00